MVRWLEGQLQLRFEPAEQFVASLASSKGTVDLETETLRSIVMERRIVFLRELAEQLRWPEVRVTEVAVLDPQIGVLEGPPATAYVLPTKGPQLGGFR